MTRRRCSSVKFETPGERTSPSSRSCTSARQVSRVLLLLRVRPVDEVDVDPVEPEPLQRLAGAGDRVVVRVVPAGDLAGHHDLVARYAGAPDRLADLDLVAVVHRGVDQPVAVLQRAQDRRRPRRRRLSPEVPKPTAGIVVPSLSSRGERAMPPRYPAPMMARDPSRAGLRAAASGCAAWRCRSGSRTGSPSPRTPASPAGTSTAPTAARSTPGSASRGWAAARPTSASAPGSTSPRSLYAGASWRGTRGRRRGDVRRLRGGAAAARDAGAARPGRGAAPPGRRGRAAARAGRRAHGGRPEELLDVELDRLAALVGEAAAQREPGRARSGRRELVGRGPGRPRPARRRRSRTRTCAARCCWPRTCAAPYWRGPTCSAPTCATRTCRAPTCRRRCSSPSPS